MITARDSVRVSLRPNKRPGGLSAFRPAISKRAVVFNHVQAELSNILFARKDSAALYCVTKGTRSYPVVVGVVAKVRKRNEMVPLNSQADQRGVAVSASSFLLDNQALFAALRNVAGSVKLFLGHTNIVRLTPSLREVNT